MIYFLIRLPSLTNALLHCSKREDLSHSWLPSSTNLVSPVIVGSGSSLIFSRTFVKKWISLIESHCRQRSWEWGHVSPLIVTVFPLNPCISKPCHFLSVSCQSLFYISLWIFETATERTSCCERARWHTCIIFKPRWDPAKNVAQETCRAWPWSTPNPLIARHPCNPMRWSV